jgi:hypothetical protein
VRQALFVLARFSNGHSFVINFSNSGPVKLRLRSSVNFEKENRI